MSSVKKYLRDTYNIDPTEPEYDSLERVMAVIYADINNGSLGAKALSAFRSVIRLFNKRIAETTNRMPTSNRGGLYRIITSKLKSGYHPSDITVVTFNQDLQIEKTLERISNTKQYVGIGPIWSFPHCYSLPNTHKLSAPPDNQARFTAHAEDQGGILVLKLHGSLNWFSWHKSSQIPQSSILSRNKKFSITPRKNIPTDMMVTSSAGKRMHTFPMVIPPVNHKAAIIHDDLQPVWQVAEDRMMRANEIIVFGYSCPSTDFESANLFRRATRPQNAPDVFSVVDPSSETFMRYIHVTCLHKLGFFRNCDSFVN